MTAAYNTAQYIPVMVERIVKAFDPVKIILFGSHARGDARPDSDIDLLVVLDRVENRHDSAVAVGSALADLPAAKDIIVTTEAEIDRIGHIAGYILRPALRDGKTIYSR